MNLHHNSWFMLWIGFNTDIMGNRGKSGQDHIVPGSLLEHIIGIEGD